MSLSGRRITKDYEDCVMNITRLEGIDWLTVGTDDIITVRVDADFNFTKVMADVFTEVFELLDTTVDEVVFKSSDKFRGNVTEEQNNARLDAIKAEMRSRQPKLERNPFYDGAATIGDVWPGVPIIIYNMKTGWVACDICESNPFVRSEFSGSVHWMYTKHYVDADGFRRDHSLADFGLEPYRSGEWNDEWITVLDTEEARAQFIAWLSQKVAQSARCVLDMIVQRELVQS